MVIGTGSAMAWLSVSGLQAQAPMLKNMGGEPPGFAFRSRAGGFDILEHCRGLGLGAVRMSLPVDRSSRRSVSCARRSTGYGMRLIISLPTPKETGALPQYEAGVRAASELGAVTTHASFTARRYEEFDSFDAFKASFERHQKSVELAEPVLRKYKMKLAIENHKGWRAAEHVAWIKRVGSEYVGACYDFGNNIALCEDPAETFKLLAPVTIYASFKDMAVAPYDEGFLLSEMALGEGMLDITGHGQSSPAEGSEHDLRARDDHARAAEDSRLHEEVLGDVRRHLQPAARPRPRARSRNRAHDAAEDAADAHRRLEPGRRIEARRRHDQSFDRLRAEEFVALVSSGGTSSPGPLYTLARRDPAPRSARVAHSLSLVRADYEMASSPD